MSIIKFLGATAIGIVSFCGAASAASVDVFYRFGTQYDVNCGDDCGGPEFGVFEVRLSYADTAFDLVPYAPGSTGFFVKYGGPATAEVTTPIGSRTYQVNGRSDALFEYFDEVPGAPSVPYYTPSETFQSVAGEPEASGQFFGAVVFDTASATVEGGTQRYSFANVSGDFMGSDFTSDFVFDLGMGSVINTFAFTGSLREAIITVTDNAIPAPSPIPLPASAPLFMAALGFLGLRRKRRNQRRG